MAREIRLLGFNLTKVTAEKKPEFSGKLQITNNIAIVSAEKHKLDLGKEEALKVTFDFDISYGTLGNVGLSGTLFLLVDSKTLKEALKSWEDQKLPDDLRTIVVNLVMQKASLKALQIEEDLGLPLHMPMPRIEVDSKPVNK